MLYYLFQRFSFHFIFYSLSLLLVFKQVLSVYSRTSNQQHFLLFPFSLSLHFHLCVAVRRFLQQFYMRVSIERSWLYICANHTWTYLLLIHFYFCWATFTQRTHAFMCVYSTSDAWCVTNVSMCWCPSPKVRDSVFEWAVCVTQERNEWWNLCFSFTFMFH